MKMVNEKTSPFLFSIIAISSLLLGLPPTLVFYHNSPFHSLLTAAEVPIHPLWPVNNAQPTIQQLVNNTNSISDQSLDYYQQLRVKPTKTDVFDLCLTLYPRPAAVLCHLFTVTNLKT
jgi:hypothetical protein